MHKICKISVDTLDDSIACLNSEIDAYDDMWQNTNNTVHASLCLKRLDQLIQARNELLELKCD